MSNLTSTDPTAPPPQPPRPSTSGCDRHPDEQFTGFCPSCLVERLSTLDTSSITPSSSHRPSSAAAAASAFKSLFTSTSRATNFAAPPPPPPKPLKPASFLPELRRSKSFSASKNEALGQSLEPHRKSCDVRAKNTLWSLFSLDDESKPSTSNTNWPLAASSSSSHQNPQISSSKPIESALPNKSISGEIESEIEEDFKDPPENLEAIVAPSEDGGDRDEIRPADDSHFQNPRNPVGINANISEIVEEKPESSSNPKPMNHRIDLLTHPQAKKTSGVGGFWGAASVFSNKWRKWRHKQKVKKQNTGKHLARFRAEKPIARHYRDTQSEIADYGFGRRSIDVDPRFSLDVPRISFDDPRYSFDEPRASWDGYVTGRNFPKIPPMVSVLENGPSTRVPRADMQIPLDPPSFFSGENVPGGSAQTRDYYLDSSSRRRKSLDRSSSIRKTAAAVVAEIDELKMASSSNAKVLPTNLVGDSYPNSLRDDASETFELSSGFRDGILGNAEKKESKKSKKWGWKIWGFLHKKGRKEEDEDDKYSKYSSANGVDRSWSQSWQELRREGNYNNGLSRNVARSNSSVSWRHAGPFGPPFVNGRRSSVDAYGNNNNGRRSDFTVDKNRNNTRYSPSHLDNGLLRFYLTPTRANRRGGTGKVKPSNPHSVGRSVMRLY
ncbi:Protein of unknown function (DUF740 [Striga hermonthica]|uniref:Uncharacterized protein n=1 Tax=Striga hermonthica TaxID=68872 RepID=A0A9N7NEY8_STRHE|nr:Protein of unknown function (DUF740 [Striga hermonthica]